MNDEFNAGIPRPVISLEYASNESVALRRVLRLVVWMFLLGQSSGVLLFGFRAGCYFMERADRTILLKHLPAFPLVIDLPQILVSLCLLINFANMLSLSSSGLRWIRVGAVIQGILASIGHVTMSLELIYESRIFYFGNAYGFYYVGQHCLYAVVSPIGYLLIYLLFRGDTRESL